MREKLRFKYSHYIMKLLRRSFVFVYVICQFSRKFVEKQRQVSLMRMQDIIEKSRAGIEHFQVETGADTPTDSSPKASSILLSPNTRVFSNIQTKLNKSNKNDNLKINVHLSDNASADSTEQPKAFFNGDELAHNKEPSVSGSLEKTKSQMSLVQQTKIK
ncbi:hypothetical protein RFI_39179 [Reticulomyxa filosa]|uniref:Uncharacterized protein n=1 Tax=Reticulomyxa filosa TaxID=46433 RepID=X6LC71_RETFI|nr:hypothetical protein RFI_39179 [Reticulomyxa filosa]|eukprot:ETN98329.1 hypothetical protein RFI_39179 [Reticulomyxa filosa]